MSDDFSNKKDGITSPQGGNDPLGIIGWVIAGKYKIRSYLGGGGFGEVYDGYNVNLPEQKLVLKFFKRVQAREKFVKEAKILCLLDHPNISRVIDFLKEEGALVVAHIDGKDGAQFLRETGKLPEKLFLKVAQTMTSALAYAHEKNIAHRDIKPGNIMIDKNEHVYLIDFGIAKEIGEAATRTAYQSLTPMFAAPERQVGDVDYNPYLSDVYEMGVTLFNFCSNTMPYRNPANPNINEWGGPEADKLSQELLQVLKKATQPLPEKRYQSTRELADEIQKIQSVYVKKRKKTSPVVISLVVIIAALAGYFGWQEYKKSQFGEKGTAVVDNKQKEAKKTESFRKPDSSIVDKDKKQTYADIARDSTEVTPVKQPSVETREEEPPAKEPVVKETAKEKPEKKKEPPPPPPQPQLRIRTKPAELIILYVDGQQWEPGRYYESTRGTHRAEVIHPDYPIYSKDFRVSSDTTNQTFDLESLPSITDSLDLRLALNPPTDKHILELTINNSKRLFTSFPVFDLIRAKGEWLLEAKIFPINSDKTKTIIVDSCVTFPFGGGRHEVVQGNKGRINFGNMTEEGITIVPFLIYWTEK